MSKRESNPPAPAGRRPAPPTPPPALPEFATAKLGNSQRASLSLDLEAQTIAIEGVTFSLSMLRDFIGALTPGARLGPFFLERKGEHIVFHTLEATDVRVLQRCQYGAEH